MDPNNEIQIEFIPFIRVYKSGRLERLNGTQVVPASVDPATGITSKDLVIDPDTGLSARLYLPSLSNPPAKKLPVLVYYHGGAFIIESAFSPTYHNYLNTLAARAGVLIVSVEYRRAPEHPLPTAHDDSWVAFRWVASHDEGCGPEEWLAERGDFGRMFLAGDSAGANIAHHMAMRAGSEGMRVDGLALIHPFFAKSDPGKKQEPEAIWRFTCPGTTGLDDPLINPLAAGAPRLVGLGCRRVMVSVAEWDFLNERGAAYYEGLVASGWGGAAELVETEGEEHVFHILRPTCSKALAFMDQVVAFLKRE